MTFAEAKQKLKKMANGKHHTLTYEEREFVDGYVDIRCAAYIDRGRWCEASSWADAFAILTNTVDTIGQQPGPEIVA